MEEGVEGIDLNTKNAGVIAPGYNPKDKPEMFVRKILQNQKRMKYTIDEYVKENNLEKEVTAQAHLRMENEAATEEQLKADLLS